MNKNRKIKFKFEAEPIHLILIGLMSFIVVSMAINLNNVVNAKSSIPVVEEPTTVIVEELKIATPEEVRASRYATKTDELIIPETTTQKVEETTKAQKSTNTTNNKSTQSTKYEEDEHGKYYWFTASCTAYCGCSKCCGSYAANRNWDENGEQIILTASGNRAVPKYTIAMSKNFKFGTKVYIEGIGMCEVMDRGGAVKGNVIDIYFGSHEEALNWGRRSIKVKIYV